MDVSFNLLIPSAFVQCTAIELDAASNTATVWMDAISATAACPACGAESRAMHSRYQRTLADLPWAAYRVNLKIRVRRFRCRSADCLRRVFTERIPDLVKPWQRRTSRLADHQTQVALGIGASAGSRMGRRSGAPISASALLRMIRSFADVVRSPPRIIGVDDWAWKKGQRYGTIIVDHERGVVVDILPDREASTLAQWLKQNPQVEVVTRDRAEVYAQAIQIGSPTAVQAADRWHLFKNLFDTIYSALQPHRSVIEAETRACSDCNASAAVTTSAATSTMVENQSIDAQCDDTSVFTAEPSLSAAAHRRFQRNQQIHMLHQQGLRHMMIASAVRCTVKTVRRVLEADGVEKRHRRDVRGSMLEEYKPFLMERWTAGCHNAVRLRREIAARGFRGGITMVRTFLHALRKSTSALDASPNAMPPRASLRTIAWSVLCASDQKLRDSISQICPADPAVVQIVDLGRQFADMVRTHESSALLGWLDRAVQSGIRALQRFANGIRHDIEAVQAALDLPWSNGRTEGHVNRLKTIKRSMYGRAKFDLLRKRVLAA